MGVLFFWQRLWFHWNEIVFAVVGAHPLVFFFKASLLLEMASPEHPRKPRVYAILDPSKKLVKA